MSDIEQDLSQLSSAEEFFAYFGLDYDVQVLAASRLHILKAFRDALSQQSGLETLEPEAQREAYRMALTAAYRRFTAGSALTERVFPKLQAAKGAFVALSSLAMTPKSGRRTSAS